jgi:hypothetical protein
MPAMTTGIDRPSYNIVPCFACGATFIYKGPRGDLNGRFCSMRCQAAYDEGFTAQPAEQPDTLIGWRVAAGGEIGSDYYADLQTRPDPDEASPQRLQDRLCRLPEGVREHGAALLLRRLRAP